MRRLLPDPPAELTDDELAAAYAVPDGRHLRVNFVASADGAATLDGRSGGLGTPGDKAVFHLLRDLCDVVLVGGGTARAENYGPTRGSSRRRALGLAPVPDIALVSGTLRLDPDSRVFAQAATRPIVITRADAPAGARAALEKVADVVVAGAHEVDLAAALDVLAGRGLRRVLSEGGPSLFGSLHHAGLVDELCLTVSPVLAGPGAARIIGGGVLRPAELTLRHLLTEDGALFLRYTVDR